MPTYTVNTADDIVDGNYSQLSLREAVNLANATTAADTIVFASALESQTLVLTGGELGISQDLTLDGDLNNDGIGVELDGNSTGSSSGSRHLNIMGNTTNVNLADLSFVRGDGSSSSGSKFDVNGGSILLNDSDLSVSNCNFSDNHASGYGDGGAIYVGDDGNLNIINSTFLNNYSAQSGGAIGAGLIDHNTVTIRGSSFIDNGADGGGGAISMGIGSFVLEDSIVSGNFSVPSRIGGGIRLDNAQALILRSTVTDNSGAYNGGGIISLDSQLTITDSTIANNEVTGYNARGGGIATRGGSLVLSNNTITGNHAEASHAATGGGVWRADATTRFEFSNNIISGNLTVGPAVDGPDVTGTIDISNGHNIFGSDVLGNNPADREKIAASAVFANIDPETGGGQVNSLGIVPLLNSANNPALSGADPLAAGATGQTGDNSRPLPLGSLPDIGAVEITHALSTTTSARNDVITGNSAANTLNGDLGNDYLKGVGGKDTLNGGDGSDLLDGGTGNDKLNGGGGIDLARFAGSTKVTFDLGTSTAKRGSETDTLTGLEGAIGSTAGDVFKGNGFNNYFQGGLGKDTATGGGGRDLYDFNALAESGVGGTKRDVITDFAHLADKIDLMGIDANSAIAGNQAFRWVGSAALTGAGQVGFFTSGGNTIIRASNDADAATDFECQLNGMKTLTFDDFYF